VCLSFDGLFSHQISGASISPYECQNEDAEQRCEFFRVSETGIFEVEAATLEIRKETLDAPASASRSGGGRLTIAVEMNSGEPAV
tara:strand:- start:966 stop:1220 length:255 start_codon:yes stop_codon:yes gene_type:complete